MNNRYHVLIVEDDPFIRKVLHHTLKDDFDLTTHSNGIEAMSWLDKGSPVDMVITDLHMPHLNGMELIQIMRASTLFRNVPVMVLSSFTDSNTRINCLEQGADDYVTKPFNPVEVKAKIMAHMRRRGTKDNTGNPIVPVKPSVGNGISD